MFSGRKKNYLGVTKDGGVIVKGIVAKCRNAPGEPRDDKQKVDAEVCRLNGELHGRVASVEELRREAEDRLRRYVELFLGRADVVVLPAVGWYEGYRFSGSLDNAGFFLIDEIYRRLEQLAPRRGGPRCDPRHKLHAAVRTASGLHGLQGALRAARRPAVSPRGELGPRDAGRPRRRDKHSGERGAGGDHA
ncbi:MAG: hypothetical protein QW086_01925 [Pyrobaculum sp.]